ncbi:uncharacterized protein LOC117124550 [Anneissia japonica]|uniref:uncharacterized protein LOC117124550 n=1 Tax=Anneissia japonica TaxID=1529436 RepID=UPI001425AA73|nr:uncharacterized protein LOC117124550 [Anneissia japonica]
MPLKKGKKKGSGKKRSAKKKLSKAEKEREKLEKATELLTTDANSFDNFVDRIDRWLASNRHKAIELFRKCDVNGDGVLTYDEFKAGMLDMEAPCSTVELHALAKNIDKDQDGTIDYLEFTKGLRYTEMANNAPSLVSTRVESNPCPVCSVGLWQPPVVHRPRYIRLHLRLSTFDNLRSYPGHFTVTVHSHISIYGITEIIKEEIDVCSTKIKIFRGKARETSNLLQADDTLDTLGFEGGTKNEPVDLTLYYDYTTEFHDCPILLTDHYFIK